MLSLNHWTTSKVPHLLIKNYKTKLRETYKGPRESVSEQIHSKEDGEDVISTQVDCFSEFQSAALFQADKLMLKLIWKCKEPKKYEITLKK